MFRLPFRLTALANLRRDLEYYASPASPAGGCSSIDVAFVVESQVGVGLGAVESGEAVQDGIGPGVVRAWRQFVDHSTAARCCPPGNGRAVEIARLVHDHAAAGPVPIHGLVNAVQNRLFPNTIGVAVHAEDDAVASDATQGRPVKVAGTVDRELVAEPWK